MNDFLLVIAIVCMSVLTGTFFGMHVKSYAVEQDCTLLGKHRDGDVVYLCAKETK